MIYVMPDVAVALGPPAYPIGKIGVLVCPKNIAVPNGTVDEEIVRTASELTQFGPSQPTIHDCVHKTILPSSDRDGAWVRLFRNPKIKRRCFLHRHESDSCVGLNIVRWRLTGVDNIGSKFKSKTPCAPLSKGLAGTRCDVGAQLPFTRLAAFDYLPKNGENEQKVGYQNSRRYGIVNHLIDDPHDRAGISYFFGVICDAIGIALFLRGLQFIGAALIGIGLLTPLWP